MQPASSQFRSTTLLWFLLPATLAWLSEWLPDHAGAIVQMLNHALYMVVAGMVLKPSMLSRWKQRHRALLVQSLFQSGFILSTLVLIITPIIVLRQSAPVAVVGLSAVSLLVAVWVLLRMWPAHATTLFALQYDPGQQESSGTTLGRGCRIGLDLTEDNTLMRIQGIVPLVLILTLNSLPLILMLMPQVTPLWPAIVMKWAYLLVLAPALTLGLFWRVDRLLRPLQTPEQSPSRSDQAAMPPAPQPQEPRLAISNDTDSDTLPTEAMTPNGTPMNPQQPARPSATDQTHRCDLPRLRDQVESGRDFNRFDGDLSPLMEVILSGHGNRAPAMALLCEHGADPDYQDSEGNTALHHAVTLNDEIGIDQLLAHKADLERINQRQMSPLTLACHLGHWTVCRQLIKAGANINQNEGLPPLVTASCAREDDCQGVDLLLAAGADCNAIDKLKRTALMNAAMSRNAQIAERLLKAGADIDRVDQFSNSALMEAARSGANSVIERFVFWNPNTELTDKLGRTALLIAVASRRSDAETIRLLIALGANPRARNAEGKEAADLAVASGRMRIAKALGIESSAFSDTEHNPQIVVEDPDHELIDFAELVTADDQDWAQEQISFLKSQTNRQSNNTRAADSATVSSEATPPSRRQHTAPVTAAAQAATAIKPSPDYDLMPDDIIMSDQPMMIDLAELQNEDDLDWARRQFIKRSRTDLESANRKRSDQGSGSEPRSSQPPRAIPAAPDSTPAIKPKPELTFELEPDLTFELEPSSDDVPGFDAESAASDLSEPADRPEKSLAFDLSEEVESPDTSTEMISMRLDSVIDLGEPEDASSPEDLAADTSTSSDQHPEPVRHYSSGQETLIQAARDENTELMQAVLMSIDEVDPLWMTSAFVAAVNEGCLLSPVWLLDHGLDANAQCSNGLALIDAMLQQARPDPQIIEALIRHGARIDHSGEQIIWLSGMTDFQHQVSRQGLHDQIAEQYKTELLATLVENGSDFKVVDDTQRTALHWAVRYRNKQFVTTLIEMDLDVNQQDADGNTPLIEAVRSSNPDRHAIIRLLISAGADPLRANELAESAMTLSMNNNDRSISRLLMMAKINEETVAGHVDDRPRDLLLAAQDGNLGRLKRLLARGDNVNIRDDDGATPLIHAAGMGHMAAISCLLTAHANPGLSTINGTTALGAAVLGDHEDAVKLLISHGVSVDQLQMHKVTPLMLAAARWNSSMVTVLLDLGANPNATDASGDSALMAAAQNAIHSENYEDGREIFDALIDHQARPDLINDEGQTALMMLLGVRASQNEAILGQNLEALTAMLIKAGTQLDTQDLTGWSALHAAAAHGLHKPARLLITAGANKRLRDINGLSACDLAMDKNDERLVQLFL